VNATRIAGECLASLVLEQRDWWAGLPFCTRAVPALPREPMRFIGARAVRAGILACEAAEDQGCRGSPLARAAARLPEILRMRFGIRRSDRRRALRAADTGRPHRLTIDDGSRRLRLPSLGLAREATQPVVHAPERPVEPPAPEMRKDSRPRWEAAGQHAPSAPGANKIEDRLGRRRGHLSGRPFDAGGGSKGSSAAHSASDRSVG
jgi:hypothetical protein